MLGTCGILSGASGVFLLLTDDGTPAVFPLVMTFLLGLGTLYFLILGAIGLFRKIPTLSEDSDEPSPGDRVFAAVFGACAGVIFGGVLGLVFALGGDFQTGIATFGSVVFALSLLSYAFPEAGSELAGEIFGPTFRFVFWCFGRFF